MPHERLPPAGREPQSGGPSVPEIALLSVVVPVFNERPSLARLLGEIELACERVAGNWEVVFVDDGSTDGSRELLERLSATNDRVRPLAFVRNRGKSAALRAGLSASRGDVVVTLDGDGQDDPASIPSLVSALEAGYDHISGWRVPRRGPRRRTWASWLFNKATARLTGLRLHDFNSGAKAYRGDCARSLAIYGDLHRFIPVIAAQFGWRVGEGRVMHREREHGRSKYGGERYTHAALDLLGVIVIGRYRNRPMHLFGGVGLALGALAAVLLVVMVVLNLLGTSVSGWPFLIAAGLAVACSIQLLAIGVGVEMLLAAHVRVQPWVVAEDISVVGESEQHARVAKPTVAETSRSQPLPTPSSR